ncbi:MAG: EAL domain-containing protein, partial [Janthinobacterium lividum]
LTQAGDGSILLGTQGGLYRYDGSSFRQDVVGLPSDWIAQVETDPAGRLWVFTYHDGLFVGDGFRFRRVDTGKALSRVIDRLTHALVMTNDAAVLDAGGTLLRAPIGAQGAGTFRPLFDVATVAAMPALNHAQFVVPDAQGGLLIGCGNALCRFAGGRVTAFGATDGLPADAWQVALRTPDGTLWVRSVGRLAWRRPGQNRFTTVTVPGPHTSYFAGTPQDLLLLADHGSGVLTQGDEGLLGWTGSNWRTYAPHTGGLPATAITGLLWDREGSLWAGSQGYGAFRDIGLNVWEHWSQEDGLHSSLVWSMTRSRNGRLWAATDVSSVPLDGGAGTVEGQNLAIATSKAGQIWLAPSARPLVRLDGDGRTTGQIASVGRVFWGMVDGQNRLWLSGRSGLFEMPDADAPAADLRIRLALPRGRCLLAIDRADTPWAACREAVFRLKPDGTFEQMIAADLPKDEPMGISFTADGELWIGSQTDGVLRFRVANDHLKPLPRLVTPTIASNSVLLLHRDRRGWMWVGTDHGIDRFDGHVWQNFDSSDGLISNDLNEYAVFEDGDGSMWFGTSHGLSHLIDPDHLPPLHPLHPVITGLSLGSRTLPVGLSVHARWSPEPLVVHFNDLDYARSRGLVFRYRLRGVDVGWNDTTAREVRYANPPAGPLRFELLAVDTVHGTVSAPIGFALRIDPPWWQRWWFYGLCSLVGGGIVIAAWQVRERLLLRQRQRLEAVVSTRTAEIEQARDQLERQANLEQQRLEHMVDERTAEIEQARKELQRLALSDMLTGLPNRRAVTAALEQAVAAAETVSGQQLAVLICDIDYFKAINDTFGHLAGDAVLAEFGAQLGAAVSSPDMVGRYGGEEFLVILLGEPNSILPRVSALHASIGSASFRPLDAAADHVVTFSGGLAFLRADDTPLSMLARADAALYRAKANGRNRIEEEWNENAPGKVGEADAPEDQATTLKRDLRLALERDEFVLHYQPILDMSRGRIVAYEALLRWTSPTRGAVPPASFIPFAEQHDLMTAIDAWVIRTACRDAARWDDDIRVAVNLSPSHFHQPDLVQSVADALTAAGLPPRRLELEVTETAMIVDVEAAAALLGRLRALGVSVALDDFGTGYSSLSFLRTLPFDRIKIDRSFVRDLGIKPEAAAIIGSVVHLCTGLAATVIAEGVETQEQVELLRAIGCREMQGFHLGRPAPASRIPIRSQTKAAHPDFVLQDG